MRHRLALLSAVLAAGLTGIPARNPAHAAQWLENHGRVPEPLVRCDLLTPQRFADCGRPDAGTRELATGSVRADAPRHSAKEATGSVTPAPRQPRDPRR